MQIIAFSDFARRRAAASRAAAEQAVLPVGDRWAALHTAGSDVFDSPETHAAPAAAEDDFWGDLNFRLAYPTHRLRRH